MDRLNVLLILPASAVLLGAGIWLVLEGNWGFDRLFIIFGLAGFAASSIVGAVVTTPSGKALRTAVELRGADSPEVDSLMRRMQFGLLIDVVILTTIVFVMVTKADSLGCVSRSVDFRLGSRPRARKEKRRAPNLFQPPAVGFFRSPLSTFSLRSPARCSRSFMRPPLFLPVALIAAAVLARARTWPGVVGAALVGLVGIAFLGGTFNLPNDIDAARAAGSPVELTIASGVLAAIFGLAFAALAAAELVARVGGGRTHGARRPAADT